jgi:glycosyltransferase involved in cell wall biosynthesis
MGSVQDLTAVVKTFRRPAQVAKALLSIKHFYPNLPVVLIDDGAQPGLLIPAGMPITYVETDFDLGLSADRNIGVDQVQSEFVLIMDDDVVLREETRLDQMLATAKRRQTVVSARQMDFGVTEQIFHGLFETQSAALVMRDAGFSGDPIAEVHYTHNFFVAPTELVRSIRWDPALKMGEHWDFFWRMRASGRAPVVCTDLFYDHYPMRSPGYRRFRQRAADFSKAALAKHGFTELKRIKNALSVHGKFKLRTARLRYSALSRPR